MIKGMTGYGHAQISTGRIKAIVEIKSLNHRYLDINFNLPIGFGSIESNIRQLLQKNMERGRVTMSVKIIDKPLHNVVLNTEAVKKHLHFGKLLKKDFGLSSDISLSDMIKLPGVLEVKEVYVTPEEISGPLDKAIQRSLAGLNQMRKREGKAIAKDVMEQIKRMSLKINRIQVKTKAKKNQKKKELNHDEFLSFQRSSDINEEISRFKHYIVEVKALLKTGVAIGKKLDFIAQEMQRETNTIGSKFQDKEVSNAVIALKSNIEKIREQAQNIE